MRVSVLRERSLLATCAWVARPRTLMGRGERMTEIVIQVGGRDSASPGSRARNVQRDFADTGARLQALHPGAPDPELRSWFLVTIPADGRPEEFIRRLLEHPDVAAAYQKPQGTPP